MNPTRARWAVLTVFAVHGTVQGSLAARMPWIAEHADVSTGQLGLSLIMPAMGALLTMPFAGRIVHRFGARLATQVLIAALGAALLLPALATNLPVLCGALFLAGACAGTADMAMNAEGVAVENLLGRPIMSSLHGGWSVGGFAAGGVGVVLARLDVAATVNFACVSAFAIIVGVTAGHWLPSGRHTAAERPAGPAFSLPRGPVLIIGLVGFCAVFAEGASADWSAIYLVNVLDASPAVGALAYASFAAAMTVARFAGDTVVRRIGAVTTTRIGGAVSTLGGLLVVASWAPAVAVVGFTLVGIGLATVVPLAFSAAGHSATGGASSTNAIAGVATVAYGAGLAAPGIIGGLANMTSLTVSFVAVTALVVVLTLAAPSLRAADAVTEVAAPALEPA